MPYLYAGVLGFLVAFAFDAVALKGWRHAKPAVGGLSAVLLLYGFLGAAFSPARFARPSWLAILGGLLAVCGAGLLIFSLFIEIPARRTYLIPGAGQELVTTGTYALCRHPGVLWFGLLLCGLVAATASHWLLVAAPVWLGLDICYVWIQDRYYFPRQFPGYGHYQQITPMLIPTPGSLRRWYLTR